MSDDQAPSREPGGQRRRARRAGAPTADLAPDTWLPTRQGHRRGAFLIALVIGAILIAFSDDGRHRDAAVLLLLPVGLLQRGRPTRSASSYWALLKGSVGSRQRDQHHARALGPADLRRPRRDAGLPRRPVQHRRPGPADHRRDLRRRTSASPGTCPPGLHLLVALVAGLARRCALGRHRRLPQGADRRPRGDHHDHAQLPRRLGAALRCSARRRSSGPAATTRSRRRSTSSATLPDAVRRHAPAACSSRSLAARRRLVAARAQHARLRAAGGRRQPRRVAHRRHERRRRSTRSRWSSPARSPGWRRP